MFRWSTDESYLCLRTLARALLYLHISFEKNSLDVKREAAWPAEVLNGVRKRWKEVVLWDGSRDDSYVKILRQWVP